MPLSILHPSVPVGFTGLPVYIDAAVMDQKRVVMGGGNRTSNLYLHPAELLKLPNARVIDGLAKPKESATETETV